MGKISLRCDGQRYELYTNAKIMHATSHSEPTNRPIIVVD